MATTTTEPSTQLLLARLPLLAGLAEDGREVVLEVISPGEALGGTVLSKAAHPATAPTMTAAETVSFPGEAYSRLIDQHPAIAQKLVWMLGARLHSLMGLQV